MPKTWSCCAIKFNVWYVNDANLRSFSKMNR
jgi:hypothetical protein